MPRSVMARVYIGDVGEIPPPIERTPIPQDLDLDSLSTRELFAIALEAGIDMKLLIGRDTCEVHWGMHKLTDRLLPVGFSFAEDVIYCRQCYDYFRPKRKD